jgi:hypothetical protein
VAGKYLDASQYLNRKIHSYKPGVACHFETFLPKSQGNNFLQILRVLMSEALFCCSVFNILSDDAIE